MRFWAHSSLRNWPVRYWYIRPAFRAQPWACSTKRSEYWGAMVFMKSAAANFENAIDKVLEFAGSRQGKMAFEDDAVEAMQGANDEIGELGQKAPYVFMAFSPG